MQGRADKAHAQGADHVLGVRGRAHGDGPLLDLCLRLDSDMSRRTLQTATAILDLLSADVDFVTRHTVPRHLIEMEAELGTEVGLEPQRQVEADRNRYKREMIKTCVGIACVASKICDAGYLTPEFMVDIGCKYEEDYGRRRYPPVSPPFAVMELVEAEMRIIRQCDWKVLSVLPMDFEGASARACASTSDPNTRIGRLHGYIVDTICCCISWGGSARGDRSRGVADGRGPVKGVARHRRPGRHQGAAMHVRLRDAHDARVAALQFLFSETQACGEHGLHPSLILQFLHFTRTWIRNLNFV